MRIVIGVDGSEQGQVGAHLVATLPLTVDDEVVVVSVVPEQLPVGAWSYVHVSQVAELSRTARDAAEASARVAVEAAATALGVLPGTVRTIVPRGHPAAALPDVVREQAADLVVVGPHGSGRLEELVLGSVAQSLLERMPSSVLVARGPVRPPTKVLLAYDGSAHSRAAAEFLATMPLPAGAEIQVLTATGGGMELLVPDAPAIEQLEAGGLKVAREGAEILEAAGRTAIGIVRPGQAKHAIVAAARDLGLDLVVLGARGLGGVRGLILGSVSRAVSRAAPCSVLVVASRGGAED